MLGLLLAVPAAAEDSAPGEWTAPEVAEFADWSVACDNARECTALSVSRDFVARVEARDPGDYAQPKLWVKRAAGPEARLRVFLDTTVWGEAGAGEAPATLHVYTECDGDCTGRAYRLIALEPGASSLPLPMWPPSSPRASRPPAPRPALRAGGCTGSSPPPG